MVVTELTDAELLDRARDGDEAAFTALYRRHHPAIRRLAASYRPPDPDDLVDAAFGHVVAQLRRRSGPTEAFRAYLFAAVHGEAAGDSAVPGPVAAVASLPALGGADRVMITRAFESLPDRWQVPLWHTTVLGTDVAGLAAALDVSPTVAAPLARYAAGKLRQAYLQAHLDAAPRPACEPHRARLTAHLRGALDSEAGEGVREHLSRCDSCRDLVAGLETVDELLARSVVPFFPTAAGRAAVPRPLGVTAPVAVVDVTADASTAPPVDPDDPASPDGLDLGPTRRWRRLTARRTREPAAATNRPASRAANGRRPAEDSLGSAATASDGTPSAGATTAAAASDGDQPGAAASRRTSRGVNGRRPEAGAGAPDDSADGDGDDGEQRRWLPSGGLAPTLGGAAAATVLVAALAVFGTAMARDDASGDAEIPSGEPLPDLEDDDGSGAAGSGEAASRARGRDRGGPPTTAPGDDERPAEDEAGVESPRQRTVSAVRSTDGADRAGGEPTSPAPGAPGPGPSRPTTTTTTPPTTEPPPDPDPAPASWQVGWAPGSPTGGTLTVTVASPSGAGQVQTAPVQVTIALSGGAHAGEGLDGRCEAAGQQVTCTVPAPAAGGSTSVAVPVAVDRAGETATVSARQAGASLGGSQTVPLDVPAAEQAGPEA